MHSWEILNFTEFIITCVVVIVVTHVIIVIVVTAILVINLEPSQDLQKKFHCCWPSISKLKTLKASVFVVREHSNIVQDNMGPLETPSPLQDTRLLTTPPLLPPVHPLFL